MMSSLLLDNHNNNNIAVDDPLRSRNNNTVADDAAPIVWDSDTTTTNPFTFWKVLRSNIMECCIPKQKKRNETSRGDLHEDTSETYHETLPYEPDATTEELSFSDTNRSAIPEETATAAATSAAMTKQWMSPHTYTIEVWNAIVTVLCLNVFVQFFTGKKK